MTMCITELEDLPSFTKKKKHTSQCMLFESLLKSDRLLNTHAFVLLWVGMSGSFNPILPKLR